MPKGKKAIHDLFSKRIAQKRKARRTEALRRVREKDPEEPVVIDNYIVNKPLFGPHKIRGKEAPVIQRKIAPTEGKATVNVKTGKDVNKLIHKPGPRRTEMDPATGAIDKVPDKTNKKRTPRKKRSSRKSSTSK